MHYHYRYRYSNTLLGLGDYCIAELSNEDGEKYVGFVHCEEDEHVIEFAVVPFIVEEAK